MIKINETQFVKFSFSLSRASIYIFTVCGVLQILLNHFLFRHAELAICAFMFILLFIKCIAKRKMMIRIPLFVVCIVMSILYSACILPNIGISIIGAMDYLFPILFFMLYFLEYRNEFDITKYASFVFAIAVTIGLFGLYQQFSDRTLFGIMTGKVAYLDEANLVYASVFRPTSFLVSNQAYAVFLGVAVSIGIAYYHRLSIRPWLKVFGFFVLGFAGIMSASKAFILMVLVAAIVTFKPSVKRIGQVLMIAMAIILFAMIVYYFLNDEMRALIDPALNRILKVFSLGEKFVDVNSSRINIMKGVWSDNLGEILLGRGLGTSSYSAYGIFGNIANNTRYTTESYFLSVLYEMGVVGVVSFVSFLLVISARLRRSGNNCLYPVVYAIISSVFVNPALYCRSSYVCYGFLMLAYLSDLVLPKNTQHIQT